MNEANRIEPESDRDNDTELFTVHGKIEMRGFDEMNAHLDMLIAKAEKLANLMSEVNQKG